MSLYHRAVLKAQLLKHLLRIPSDRQLALLLKSGDINRFSSDKRLVAWAGLAPGVRQSGDKTVHGRITKEGNRLVRWVMVQAAQTARLHDERFREFCERYSRRKGHQKAVIAVAHEMLRIVYFMLKRNEVYRGGSCDLSLRKLNRLERVTLVV